MASVRLSRLLFLLLLRSLCAVLLFNLSRMLHTLPPRHFSLRLFLTLDLFLPFHEATLAALCHNTPYIQTPQAIQPEPKVLWYSLRLLELTVHPLLAFGRENRLASLLAS